jgi:hypothetical protein
MDDMTAIKDTRLQALVRYWAAKCGAQAMPSRRTIDPLEIPSLLPIVLLADVSASGGRIRLLGSGATEAYGQETRGKWAHELELGDFTPLWRDAFARVVKLKMPVYAIGTFRRSLRTCDVEAVLLPLSDDGLTLHQILGGLMIRPSPASDRIAPKIVVTYPHLAQVG